MNNHPTALSERSIDTAKGPAFVRTAGSGPPMLVLHGGPGFDQEPLLSALEAVQKHRTLIFFDQLGCGRTPTAVEPVTAEATFAHAAALVDALGPEPLGIVAHSWGTVVAAAIAALRPERAFAETLLVSPVAIDGAGYAAARAAIAERIPETALNRMWAMLSEGASGGEAFAVISPYYAASQEVILPPFDVAAPVFASVDASLGPFDFRPSAERFGPLAIVRGAEDFVPSASLDALRQKAGHDLVLPDVGHFPFFEAPKAFSDAIDRVLGETA